MASRVFAKFILEGTVLFSRAFFTAYQKALQNAKAGGNAQRIITKHKMQVDEALKILHLDKNELVLPRVEAQYSKYFESNDPAKGGSFYIQSKVYRAKEALETAIKEAEVEKEREAKAKTSAENVANGNSNSSSSGNSNSSKSSSNSSSNDNDNSNSSNNKKDTSQYGTPKRPQK